MMWSMRRKFHFVLKSQTHWNLSWQFSCRSSLDRLMSSGSVDEPFAVSSDLLILRCCIVLWSDERVFSNFLSRPMSKSALSKLLEIAWSQNCSDSIVGKEIRRRQSKSVSHLNIHEARFSHITWFTQRFAVTNIGDEADLRK